MPVTKKQKMGNKNLSEGPCLLHELLPEDVLVECLKFVDDKTLVTVCSRVCRLWNAQVIKNSFWLQRCIAKKIRLPPKDTRTRGEFDWKVISRRNPYGRNLIKNPSGAEGKAEWTIDENGDGFQVETPPIGGVDITSVHVCFATSFIWCSKRQLVDLHKEGVQAWVLDELKPIIRISESHAARPDCAAKYEIRVTLSSSTEVGAALDQVQFKDQHDTEQWTGKEWKTVSHSFSDYPKGMRYVIFESRGKDGQFWKGWYGAKMCNASVTISFEES